MDRCPDCKSHNIRERTNDSGRWDCAVCGLAFSTPIVDKTIEAPKTLRKFPSGATRSADADDERYDLIPAAAVKREAIVMALGAKTHGDRNWENGIPITVCLNHLERHINLYKSGDTSEDHLAKIRINAGFIMHFEEEEERKLQNGIISTN